PPSAILLPYTTLFRSQVALEGGEEMGVVVNKQDALRHGASSSGGMKFASTSAGGTSACRSGRRMRKVVPRPVSVVKSIAPWWSLDRKSTRLNSSHVKI